MDNFARCTDALIAEARRHSRLSPDTIGELPSYQVFIQEAEAAGWTGPDIDMDERFAERPPEWFGAATVDERQRWLHTLLRAERWNAECPMAILEAFQTGQLEAFAGRLRAP